MAAVLRAERVWVETFTGLRMAQFSGLLKVVRERGGNGTLRGRPWSLPLAERVLMVAVYYRTNLTMRQLGPLFGVSSSTVCRVIQRLGLLLALEPVNRAADAPDRVWIVDGTHAMHVSHPLNGTGGWIFEDNLAFTSYKECPA